MQIKTGGEFYKCFEIEKQVGVTKYNPLLPIHISWDDNVNPYLPCGIFQIEIKDGTKYVRMIDEIAGKTPNNTIRGVCAEFERRYLTHSTGLFVYGDATAQKQDTKLEKGYNFFRLIMDYMSKYHPQLRVLAANPSVAMRGMWLKTVLEKEIGNIQLTIGEHCTHTINDFVHIKEAADGTKAKETETDPRTKVRYERYGHFTDLFDYLMCYAFAKEYAEYQRGGRVLVPTIGKNYSKNRY